MNRRIVGCYLIIVGVIFLLSAVEIFHTVLFDEYHEYIRPAILILLAIESFIFIWTGGGWAGPSKAKSYSKGFYKRSLVVLYSSAVLAGTFAFLCVHIARHEGFSELIDPQFESFFANPLLIVILGVVSTILVRSSMRDSDNIDEFRWDYETVIRSTGLFKVLLALAMPLLTIQITIFVIAETIRIAITFVILLLVIVLWLLVRGKSDARKMRSAFEAYAGVYILASFVIGGIIAYIDSTNNSLFEIALDAAIMIAPVIALVLCPAIAGGAGTVIGLILCLIGTVVFAQDAMKTDELMDYLKIAWPALGMPAVIGFTPHSGDDYDDSDGWRTREVLHPEATMSLEERQELEKRRIMYGNNKLADMDWMHWKGRKDSK